MGPKYISMRIILLFTALLGTCQLFAQNIGIGTVSPSDKLHISAATSEDPLRVQINGTTKLRVHANGGVGIGAGLTMPPDNGLLVAGIIRPLAGIETASKLIVESTGDSIILNAGGSQVIVAANGNIIIRSAPGTKIDIDAGANLTITAAQNITMTAIGTMSLNASQIRLNGSSKPIARLGDTVSPTNITSGNPTVLTN